MVGQSEYVVNGGLTFATDGGFSATALYNVVGRRILEAGTGGLPDAYEEARHLVDVALQIPLGRQFGAEARREEPARFALPAHPGRRAAAALEARPLDRLRLHLAALTLETRL